MLERILTLQSISRAIVAVAALVLLTPVTIFAQSSPGSISGSVLDPSGASIPGALVTLTNRSNASTTDGLTDRLGAFRFDGLTPGDYRLSAAVPDFRTWNEEFVLNPGQHVVVRAPLQIAPSVLIQERVMVIADPSETISIPGSAHYIGQEELERAKIGFDDIHAFLRPIPGVNIQEEDGFGLRPNIGMRGTGVERSAKITLMEDGVLIAPAPYSSPSAYYFPVSGRMEAIEVRKGSSQIKYGPQSNGGALNLISTHIPDAFRIKGNLTAGAHGTAKGFVSMGDSYERFGWMVETYQIDSGGFKQIDGGGDTGFNVNDYVGKFRFNSGPMTRMYQELEIKLGRTDQTSNETYLGLTDEDFRNDSKRRYAASQRDVFHGNHAQYQARHLIALSNNLDVTTVVYRNEFKRNWYKLQSVSGVNISNILEDPARYNSELAFVRGADSQPDALRVRANNRSYFSSGVQSIVGLRLNAGRLRNAFEFGVRYHRDEEDRFQHEDGYQMRDGQMRLTSSGAGGSQSNRIGGARALAVFVEDKIEWGRWTLTPGFRYEHIDLTRTDFSRTDPGRNISPRPRLNTVGVVVPGLGLTFDYTPDLSLFGGLNKGFGPPGPGSSEDTKAEESLNYEGGFRYRKQTLSVEALGFLNDYTNLLGRDTLSSGGDDTGLTFNGGAARVVGLEAAASYDLGRGFGFQLPSRVSYTFTNAEFQSAFRSDYAPWGTVRPGDRLPYLPRHNLHAGATLERPRWTVDLSSTYVSSMRIQAGQGDTLESEATQAHLLLDLSGAYRLREDMRLFVAVQNLTDNAYVTARRPAGARPGLPRTVTAGLKFDIGR
jgi:Fe(3+) dicitrate transport protein